RLGGGQLPARLAGELRGRAEGNPFFTEQLLAAALAPRAGGAGDLAGLPARLADLLLARAGGCGADARRLLEALAVAGRPLTEDLLAGMTGLAAEAGGAGVRGVGAARVPAADHPRGAGPPP